MFFVSLTWIKTIKSIFWTLRWLACATTHANFPLELHVKMRLRWTLHGKYVNQFTSFMSPGTNSHLCIYTCINFVCNLLAKIIKFTFGVHSMSFMCKEKCQDLWYTFDWIKGFCQWFNFTKRKPTAIKYNSLNSRCIYTEKPKSVKANYAIIFVSLHFLPQKPCLMQRVRKITRKRALITARGRI